MVYTQHSSTASFVIRYVYSVHQLTLHTQYAKETGRQEADAGQHTRLPLHAHLDLVPRLQQLMQPSSCCRGHLKAAQRGQVQELHRAAPWRMWRLGSERHARG